MDYKVPCMLLTLISPVLLFETGSLSGTPGPYMRPPPAPTPNRRNFVPDGLAPYNTNYGPPYRYELPSNGANTPLSQYNRPIRAAAAPKSDMMSGANGPVLRRQRAPAPMPRYAKFTVDDASAGYLNLPHGFQNPIKPSGFQPGNLFSAYKYTPAAGHLPLNSLSSYYGAGASYGVEASSNLGPSVFPDSQTEKPIEEPMQEAPMTPTPVSELTKAAVLHQHMFTSPSTEKPTEVTPSAIPSDLPAQDVQYEIKYVPVYVDEEGKEVKNDELTNYRLKFMMDPTDPAKYVVPSAAPTQAFVSVPTKTYVKEANVAYKYAAHPTSYASASAYKYPSQLAPASYASASAYKYPSQPASYAPATSYKYESQKFIPTGYESSLSSVSTREANDKEEQYPSYAPKYEFGYRVHDSYTGSDFGQSEHRDGEVTKGSYHVLLPDGRHQTVNYWSDDSGFHAKVKYDGIAKHYPAPTKSYEAKGYEQSVDSNAIHS